MKTSAKQLATGTFIALILLVGNVYATGTGTGTEAKASSHEAIESTLQLEKWMIDETIWDANSAMFVNFVQETETDLVLEDWMTSNETWNIVDNSEAELTVESWMTDSNIWK